MKTKNKFDYANECFAASMGISDERNEELSAVMGDIVRRSLIAPEDHDGDGEYGVEINYPSQALEEIIHTCNTPEEVALCTFNYAMAMVHFDGIKSNFPTD